MPKLDPDTVAELKKKLTAEQYDVCFRSGTEPPFSGELIFEQSAGTYHCAVCGELLFASTAKFFSKNGLAEFRCTDQGVAGGTPGSEPWDGPHRHQVQYLWRPPGPRVRRRADCNRQTLLHQLARPTIQEIQGITGVAYQVVGDAPRDLVYVMGWVSMRRRRGPRRFTRHLC